MKIKKINGYKIKYFYKNNHCKNTLFFVHGYNSSSDFAQKIYNLENNFNIISINLPGSKYVKSHVDLEMKEIVSILEKFIKKIWKRNIYIVAHSLAGAIVTEIKTFSKIKGFVFLSTLNPYIAQTKRYKAMLQINNANLKMPSKIMSFLNNISIQAQNLKNEKIRELGKSFYFFTNPPIGLRKIFKENMWNPNYLENQLLENYRKVKKPILAICGLKDVVIDYKTFASFAEQELKVKAHLIANSGHNPINDQPQVISQLLNGFIASE